MSCELSAVLKPPPAAASPEIPISDQTGAPPKPATGSTSIISSPPHLHFSKNTEKKINFFFFFFKFLFFLWLSFFFLNRWQDLKMALHGLTLRKAEADLFDCCWFVTVEAALSDWTLAPFSSWSFFFSSPGHRDVFFSKDRGALSGLIP